MSLDQQLLEAHRVSDTAALASLYGQAADEAERQGDIDATCFFLTQAYVFALDAGSSLAAEFNRRLAGYERDVLRPDLKQELRGSAKN